MVMIMPIEQVHKEKKSKNFALLAVLLGLVMLFFGLTIVKLQS